MRPTRTWSAPPRRCYDGHEPAAVARDQEPGDVATGHPRDPDTAHLVRPRPSAPSAPLARRSTIHSRSAPSQAGRNSLSPSASDVPHTSRRWPQHTSATSTRPVAGHPRDSLSGGVDRRTETRPRLRTAPAGPRQRSAPGRREQAVLQAEQRAARSRRPSGRTLTLLDRVLAAACPGRSQLGAADADPHRGDRRVLLQRPGELGEEWVDGGRREAPRCRAGRRRPRPWSRSAPTARLRPSGRKVRAMRRRSSPGRPPGR